MNKYKAASLNEAIQAIQGCDQPQNIPCQITVHVRMQIGNLYDKSSNKTTVTYNITSTIVERWLLKIVALCSKDGFLLQFKNAFSLVM